MLHVSDIIIHTFIDKKKEMNGSLLCSEETIDTLLCQFKEPFAPKCDDWRQELMRSNYYRIRRNANNQVISLKYDDYNLTGSLPVEFTQLTELRELHLERNQLTVIPVEMSRLSKLQHLFLYRNHLTSLPVEMCYLTALQRLHLDSNRLTSLPVEIGCLSMLRELDLSHNQLTSLPSEICQLSALQVLSLNNNQLANLPSETSQLSALRFLMLQDNQLTSIPADLNRLYVLEEVTLDNNCLLSKPIFPPTTHVNLGTQRLPAMLLAPPSSSISTNPSIIDETDFALHFNKKWESLTLRVNTALLATHWAYFRRLLDSGMNEAQSMAWDCSDFFSPYMGWCLVNYFAGRPVAVALLDGQDCRDFIQHAERLDLQDTLLFQFCQTKVGSHAMEK